MPLRSRLSTAETLQGFELAWPERYYEGLELMVDRRVRCAVELSMPVGRRVIRDLALPANPIYA